MHGSTINNDSMLQDLTFYTAHGFCMPGPYAEYSALVEVVTERVAAVTTAAIFIWIGYSEFMKQVKALRSLRKNAYTNEVIPYGG